MKRKLLGIALMAITMLVSASTVSAYSETSYMAGPETTNGGFTTTGITKITSPTYNYVRGDRTYVFFTSLGTLRASSSIAKDYRAILIWSFEDDVEPNQDEEIKVYTGHFMQRQLATIQYSSTTSPNNIDSNGDPTVELYLKQHMEAFDGDVIGGNNGPVYYYKFRVD